MLMLKYIQHTRQQIRFKHLKIGVFLQGDKIIFWLITVTTMLPLTGKTVKGGLQSAFHDLCISIAVSVFIMSNYAFHFNVYVKNVQVAIFYPCMRAAVVA